MNSKKFRLVRYILVGGFGAISYIVISYILVVSGMRPWISSVMVYACLIPIIYLMQKYLVFHSENSHMSAFPKYLIIQSLGLTLSAALPFGFEKIGLTPEFSFVFVVLFISIVNYHLQLRWAFFKVQ